MEERIATLRRILDGSAYTVALCGSGMMEEGGFFAIKAGDRAYEIEQKYGYSTEEIFTSSFYTARPMQFFEFYREEILKHIPETTESGTALAQMERAGKLQCIISSNIFEQGKRAGCKNMIYLHGSVYHNECPKCGRKYPMEYVRDAKGIPACESCGFPIRPGVYLFGEMVDSGLLSRAVDEIAKADVLLLLGTSLNSEVFGNYIKYFGGKYLIIIHKHSHYLDDTADMVFLDHPRNILPLLGYGDAVEDAVSAKAGEDSEENG